mgnify:CR=1 FL=1
MQMKKVYHIFHVLFLMFVLTAAEAYAQNPDRKDVRRGNRDFRKENYREAEVDYLKAIVKDSMSVAANYNMASTHFRNGDAEQARKNLDRIKEAAPLTPSAADYFYNLGDVALAQKDYQTAVDAFAQSLVLRPDDLDAKENYIYAKKMLQNQQNNQNQDNQNNQDNQDNQDNKDNQNNQDNKDNQDNQDKNNQNQDNQNNQNNQDDQKNNDNQNDNKQDQNGQQPKISPQAAQQMLQAIQAKEKETQDKVNKEKAKALNSRQKEKNW